MHTNQEASVAPLIQQVPLHLLLKNLLCPSLSTWGASMQGLYCREMKLTQMGIITVL